LEIKAKETGLDGRQTILPVTIPIKPRLDNIDDMFRIVGDAEVSVDENLPVETAAFTPTVAWGEGYKSSMPVVWSLHGVDPGLLRIDAATGVVRFITPPDYEGSKKTYEFIIKAKAVGGQLVNQKAVTINIQDVDDNAPSKMLIIDVHDDKAFTQDDLDVSANRKLAKIRFKDVDSQTGNDVEIDAASQKLFELRPATHADGTIKEGTYRLWLKDGVTLEAGGYTITITAVIQGARVEDMQQTFTFTVTAPELASDDESNPETRQGGQQGNSPLSDPPPSNHPDGQRPPENQLTEVVKFRGLPELEIHQSQMDNALSVDVLRMSGGRRERSR